METENATEESDFYHWACNKRERWEQWQALLFGTETAVYSVYRKEYQLFVQRDEAR